MTALVLYVAGQALVWELGLHFRPGRVLTLPLLHLSTFALGILLARWQSLQRERGTKAAVPAWRVYAVLGVSTAALAFSIRLQPLFHVPSPYNSGTLAPFFAGFIWAQLPLSFALVVRPMAGRSRQFQLYALPDSSLHCRTVSAFAMGKLNLLSNLRRALYRVECAELPFLRNTNPPRLVERFQARRLEPATPVLR